MAMSFDVQADVDIANTMQVPARADRYLRIHQIDDALADESVCGEWLGDPATLVVGGGSNILFVAPRIEKVVRVTAAQFGYFDEPNTVLIWAEAGLGFDDCVRWTTQQGWYGLERLAEIPGSVGAAPMQNVGAYGVQLSDLLVSVDVWDRVKNCRAVLPAAACDFGYRHSMFKAEPNRWLILKVTARLQKSPPPDWPPCQYPGLIEMATAFRQAQTIPLATITPQDMAQIVTRVRQQKLPDWRQPQVGSLGSFFQNPVVSAEIAAHLKSQWPNAPIYPQKAAMGEVDQVKLSAGWLIELAGWRGFSQNNAGVYAQHALVLVNLGGAQGRDLWHLAQRIAADVLDQFGVTLVPEPLIIHNE